ncbi:trehalase-like domain-containing protein [Pseudonocardia nigra]|uniref:trehalase-like domain-containing protein n=1 Tax=Pseudonocardia nigra TaxID=1921578 RepID=UPI001C5F0219|nr:trehalase-like domain-containing protein [Pseudonocardia nigra]
MAEPDGYPPLEALAAIGDGRSLALLGPDARVEWFCPGRFDAEPALWPLLDRARGGHPHAQGGSRPARPRRGPWPLRGRA